MDSTVTSALRSWLRPPRPHGAVIEHRVVSPIELFYDLVFVVLISQIAHRLAEDVHAGSFGIYVVLFTLIWFAWLNGTLYHELHGGEDGRSRSFVFVQMAILVVLASYAADAARPDGSAPFAIAYAVLVGVLAIQWLGVRRQDSAIFAALTTRYVATLVLVGVAVGLSVLVESPTTRVWVWAGAVVVAVLVVLASVLVSGLIREDALQVSDSLVERFGLLVIIVLGEVVVGVIDGLAATDRNLRTVATGLLSLMIGFGFWWVYFDFAGRRAPRSGGGFRVTWLLVHLPLVLGIAAAGAGMVGLVEHAGAARTPASTAWLIGGATAAVAGCTAVLVAIAEPHPGRRVVPWSLGGLAAAYVAVAALRPSPWLLALLPALGLAGVWVEAFARHARLGLPIADLD